MTDQDVKLCPKHFSIYNPLSIFQPNPVTNPMLTISVPTINIPDPLMETKPKITILHRGRPDGGANPDSLF